MSELELLIALRDHSDDQETLYFLGRVYYTQNSFRPAGAAFRRNDRAGLRSGGGLRRGSPGCRPARSKYQLDPHLNPSWVEHGDRSSKRGVGQVAVDSV